MGRIERVVKLDGTGVVRHPPHGSRAGDPRRGRGHVRPQTLRYS